MQSAIGIGHGVLSQSSQSVQGAPTVPRSAEPTGPVRRKGDVQRAGKDGQAGKNGGEGAESASPEHDAMGPAGDGVFVAPIGLAAHAIRAKPEEISSPVL